MKIECVFQYISIKPESVYMGGIGFGQLRREKKTETRTRKTRQASEGIRQTNQGKRERQRERNRKPTCMYTRNGPTLPLALELTQRREGKGKKEGGKHLA